MRWLVGAGAGARHEVRLEDAELRRGEGWGGTLLWQQGGTGHDQHKGEEIYQYK